MFSSLSRLTDEHLRENQQDYSKLKYGDLNVHSTRILLALVKHSKYDEFHSKYSGEVKGFLELQIVDESVNGTGSSVVIYFLQCWGTHVMDKLRYIAQPNSFLLIQNPTIFKHISNISENSCHQSFFYLSGSIFAYHSPFLPLLVSQFSWISSLSSVVLQQQVMATLVDNKTKAIEELMKGNSTNKESLRYSIFFCAYFFHLLNRFPRSVSRRTFPNVFATKNVFYFNISIYICLNHLFSGKESPLCIYFLL